jgi:hypothetical protein
MIKFPSALAISLATASVVSAAPTFAASSSAEATPAVIAPPAPGKAQIVFWRPDKWFGKAIRCTVRENGKMVGRPGPGRYFILPVEPGAHRFTTKTEASDALGVELEPDQTFYVKCSMVPGVITYNANIAPSSKDEFGAISHKLKMMKMDDLARDIANDDKKRAAQ